VTSGIRLARRYYKGVVAPLLKAKWPDLAYAAARVGTGSEVLGLDDDMSRDHDWGLRLELFVEPDAVDAVSALLDQDLPEVYSGSPVRFATTWDATVRHRVEVVSVGGFTRSRLGIDATADLAVVDWLCLTGQSVLEVVSGPVFADGPGTLTLVRRKLEWYPDDLWRYVVAADWRRLGQEMPVMSRAGERGDAVGSRVVAARLVGTALHLAFLLQRRWPPYPKWLGTAFVRLPLAIDLAAPLGRVLDTNGWRERQEALEVALAVLLGAQRDAGLPVPSRMPTAQFFDRPFQGVRDEVVAALLESVTDPIVRQLPPGVGAVEQWVDNVDVLTSPSLRRAVATATLSGGVVDAGAEHP
jgi:hypothetical protein